MHTVAVLNRKGGVGKTTLAVNLAAAAHLDGQRTLVIDMDEQGSASKWFAAREDGSKLDGLNVVKVETRLTMPKMRALAKGYDAVVLDGPPSLDEVTLSAAALADVVVVPVPPGPFDLWATGETLRTIDRADEIRAQLDLAPTRRLFVVNRAKAGSTLSREAPEVLAGRGEVLHETIHDRIAFARSAIQGESVLTAGGDESAAAEMRALHEAVFGRKTKR